jgi:predicted nucleotidyltransferase
MDGEERTVAAAELLAGQIADVVGEQLCSVVLHGSLASGGFRPGRSDLDLLVVLDELTDVEADALVTGVRAADVGEAAGIDLHVVTADVARSPTSDPAYELYLGSSSGELEIGRRTRDPDLLAELSIARTNGRALRGAAPAEVIAPVPAAWVVERNHYWLERWRSLTDDERNAAFMVLTACRMWRFADEHVHSSKAVAGAWALERDPSLDVVRRALAQYDGDPGTQIDPAGIAALLDLVLRETSHPS